MRRPEDTLARGLRRARLLGAAVAAALLALVSLEALLAGGPCAARGEPARPARGEGELHKKADEVFSRSEWRQLRRQAEDAKEEDRSSDGWFDKCDDGERREPRKRAEPSGGCDGCSGCQGCAGVGQGVSGLMSVLTGLLIAALVGFLLWAIWKAFDKKKDDEDDGFGEGDLSEVLPETPPGEHPASIYLREALALAEKGDYKGALRQLLLGCMAWTERQGYLRYRRGLTNRDYLRALKARPGHAGAMREVVREFEEVYFGRRPATRERFERVLPDYQAAFESDDREPGNEDAALSPAG